MSWVFYRSDAANFTHTVVEIFLNVLILLTFKRILYIEHNPTLTERILAILTTLGFLADLVPRVTLRFVESLNDQPQAYVLFTVIVHDELVGQIRYFAVDCRLSDICNLIQVFV